jgi:hypothetical protein
MEPNAGQPLEIDHDQFQGGPERLEANLIARILRNAGWFKHRNFP